MSVKHLFKLEKLKIKAFSDAERHNSVDTFEVMFNPESFEQRYRIAWGCGQGLQSSDQAAVYTLSPPGHLNLRLLIDGTGVHEIGILKLGRQQTVAEQVKKFLQLTYSEHGDTHEPCYLQLEWGVLNFSCRLSDVTVTYTNFDRDGTPLRAELDVRFVSDTATRRRLNQEKTSSPDLTHRRPVKAGDTLPLLTQAIYGSAAHYLRVAEHNGLDGFRDLRPGQELSFPPLDRLPRRR